MKKILLLFLFFVLLNNLLIAGTIILKKGIIYINNDKVYLKDIAKVKGFGNNNEKVGEIYLRRAAVPGYKTVITKQLIFNKVRKVINSGKINIIGPEKIYIKTNENIIKEDDIIKVAKDYILNNMPWKKEDVNINIKKKNKDLKVLGGDVLLKVKENNHIKFKGNVVVPVNVYVNDRFYKIVPVSFLIRVKTNCFIAKEEIKRREEEFLDKVKMVKKDITFLPDDVITNIGDLNNKIPRRTIKKGIILLDSMFEKKPLFRRGERVKVRVKIKNMIVETEGISFNDGYYGEKAKVKLNTGKIITGKVDKEGNVIIKK